MIHICSKIVRKTLVTLDKIQQFGLMCTSKTLRSYSFNRKLGYFFTQPIRSEPMESVLFSVSVLANFYRFFVIFFINFTTTIAESCHIDNSAKTLYNASLFIIEMFHALATVMCKFYRV